MLKIKMINGSVYMIDNNNDAILIDPDKISKKPDTKGKRWITLPPNSLNRKLVCLEYLMKAGEITFDNPIIRNPGSFKSEKWSDFLTDEEKETIAKIKADCETRMNSPIRKQLAEIEKLKAQLAAAEEALRVAQEEIK